MEILAFVYLFNIYLSFRAFLDEFKGIKMKTFERLHWMLALFFFSLVINYYQINENLEIAFSSGGFGGIVTFTISTIAQILIYSLFFMICLKNIIVASYFILSGLDTGPKRNEKIDGYIEEGDVKKALSSLIWLERQYPTNLYINETLLKIYKQQFNTSRALDKINCLCRFHSDHENFNDWIEQAIEIDETAGLHIKKVYTSTKSSDLT